LFNRGLFIPLMQINSVMKKIALSVIFCTMCFCSVRAQVPAYIDTNSLLSWWPFRGDANDMSGHGNTGIVTGAVLATDRFGNPGNCYYFDGLSYILTSDTTNAPQGSVPRSFSCWFNTNYSTMSGFGEIGFGWGSNISHGTRFQYSIYRDETYFVGEYADYWGTINVTDSMWHNIIITYDRDTVKMYIDGTLDTFSQETLNTTGEQYKFATIVDGHDDYFHGYLDDVAVWGRVLTQCEITKVYLATATLFVTQPQNDTVMADSSAVFSFRDTGGAATYQWQVDTGSGFMNITGGAPYFGTTTRSLTVNPVTTTMSNYRFRAFRTAFGTCVDTSVAATLVLERLGVSSSIKSLADFSIYPNPAGDELHVISIANAPLGSVQLLNELGQLVMESCTTESSLDLNLQNLPKGLYFIRLNTPELSGYYKVWKK